MPSSWIPSKYYHPYVPCASVSFLQEPSSSQISLCDVYRRFNGYNNFNFDNICHYGLKNTELH